MRSRRPREPTEAVAFSVHTADASAATETLEALSSINETGDVASLLICNENVSVSLPVLKTRTSSIVSVSGSMTTAPFGPCKTKSISRSTSNEKSRTNETDVSEARVEVSRSEQTSPTLAVVPTSTWKDRSSLASTLSVEVYVNKAAVHGPDRTDNAYSNDASVVPMLVKRTEDVVC